MDEGGGAEIGTRGPGETEVPQTWETGPEKQQQQRGGGHGRENISC